MPKVDFILFLFKSEQCGREAGVGYSEVDCFVVGTDGGMGCRLRCVTASAAWQSFERSLDDVFETFCCICYGTII